MLEERLDEGAYSVRESSGITVPPAPLAAVHPELEVVLDQSIKKFKRAWLNGSDSIDLTLSPPWGSAWLLPTGNLPEEEIEEQVIWELEQRLDSPLDDYIYAWHPLDDQAYAIVIRPELLQFWDRIADKNSLEVGAVTLLAGLVEPSIERGADLMPLYRLWANRKGAVEIEDEPFDEFSDVDLSDDISEDIEDLDSGETYMPESLADDDEADEALQALLGESRGKAKVGKPARISGGNGTLKRFIPLIIVFLLLGSVAALVLLRDRIPAVGNFLAKLTPAEQEAAPAVAHSPEAISFQIVTVPLQEVPPPPELASTGSVLSQMFEMADINNVDLLSTILQGQDVTLEVVGDEEAIRAWEADLGSIQNAPTIQTREPAPLTPGIPVDLSLASSVEELMTTTQFADLVHSLGIEDYGRHAYIANRDAMLRLLSVMRGERRRPFRLSIHHAPGDRYLLVMFP